MLAVLGGALFILSIPMGLVGGLAKPRSATVVAAAIMLLLIGVGLLASAVQIDADADDVRRSQDRLPDELPMSPPEREPAE